MGGSSLASRIPNAIPYGTEEAPAAPVFYRHGPRKKRKRSPDAAPSDAALPAADADVHHEEGALKKQKSLSKAKDKAKAKAKGKKGKDKGKDKEKSKSKIKSKEKS